jgi:hypothetical protein
MTTDFPMIKKEDKVELPNGNVGTVLMVKGNSVEVEIKTKDGLVYERTFPVTNVKKLD